MLALGTDQSLQIGPLSNPKLDLNETNLKFKLEAQKKEFIDYSSKKLTVSPQGIFFCPTKQ